jgi:hypothetical protein
LAAIPKFADGITRTEMIHHETEFNNRPTAVSTASPAAGSTPTKPCLAHSNRRWGLLMLKKKKKSVSESVEEHLLPNSSQLGQKISAQAGVAPTDPPGSPQSQPNGFS